MASDEEEEEYLVHVDFDAVLENDIFNKPNLFFRVIGIDSDKPVMQIEDQVFVGDYRDIPGTSLFFQEDLNPVQDDAVFGKNAEKQLKYVCKTRKALVMRRVFVKKKDPNVAHSEVVEDELTDEEIASSNGEQLSPPVGDDGEKFFPSMKAQVGDKPQRYDIGEPVYRKKRCFVRKKLLHVRTKRSNVKAKKSDEREADGEKESDSGDEPVAGPSWLPDVTPADDMLSDVPEVIPSDVAHCDMPEVTPSDVAHSDVPEMTPSDVAHSDVPEMTPSDVAHSDMPEVTPSDVAHSDMPEVTPSDVTPSDMPEVTPTEVMHCDMPQVTPTEVTHSDMPEVTPSDVAHSDTPEVTPTEAMHCDMPQVTPTEVTHSDMPTSAPSQARDSSLPHTAPSDVTDSARVLPASILNADDVSKLIQEQMRIENDCDSKEEQGDHMMQ